MGELVIGANHACALMRTGGLRCWSNGRCGALGTGNADSSTEPPDTDVITGARAVVVGILSIAGTPCSLRGGSTPSALPSSTEIDDALGQESPTLPDVGAELLGSTPPAEAELGPLSG